MSNTEFIDYAGRIGTTADRVDYRRKYIISFDKAIKELVDFVKNNKDASDGRINSMVAVFKSMFRECVICTAREEAATYAAPNIRATEEIKARSISFDNIVQK